eukprot:6205377-Pleurochrysis_carterae.AAC.5
MSLCTLDARMTIFRVMKSVVDWVTRLFRVECAPGDANLALENFERTLHERGPGMTACRSPARPCRKLGNGAWRSRASSAPNRSELDVVPPRMQRRPDALTKYRCAKRQKEKGNGERDRGRKREGEGERVRERGRE